MDTSACAGYDPETDDEAFVFTDVGTSQCSACATSCSSCEHFRVCGCAVRDYEKYRGANACVECMDTCLQTNG